MKSEELRRCPFCGETPIANVENTNGIISGYVCEIYCHQCRLNMSNGRIIMAEKIGESEAEREKRKESEMKYRFGQLVSRWNERSSNDE